MDALFLHPKVVHIRMALGVLMPLIVGGLLLAWWRDWFKRAGAWSTSTAPLRRTHPARGRAKKRGPSQLVTTMRIRRLADRRS
jgi:hypothetical protein